MKEKIDLQSEIRYAIRLCERTARLYRKVQTVATVLAIVGGSAALAAVTDAFPEWFTLSGAVILTVSGAAFLAVRPADKAAQNEADARKYQTLLAKSVTMTEADLEQSLEETRQGSAPEIEPLREVAYNDVARELGRPDAVIPLSTAQRILAALA